MNTYETDWMSGDPLLPEIVGRRQATAVGTNAGVTATISAVGTAGNTICPTGIQCSGDGAALVTIESPASTVLYTKRFAAAFTMSETFYVGSLAGAVEQDTLVKISASTAHCEANIQGVVVPQIALDSPGNQLP